VADALNRPPAYQVVPVTWQPVQSLFLASLAVLFLYPFIIYPAVVALWAARMKPRKIPDSEDALPPVSVVICALNEERVIRAKLENSLNLSYPREKLAIVVISDGSTDKTANIVREYSGQGVLLIEKSTRRGKITNLNEVILSRREDIIVLSDANVMYHHDALTHLVRRFRDPSVGCVSGKVILTDTTPDLDSPTQQYYSLEWKLQECSSALHSMPGADGAMYALRRELFRACPVDTLIEDFVIPMQIIAQGQRVVFEPQAVGWENGVASLREEFRRKIRIAAGAAQALKRGSAWPKHAPLSFWFVFISHKLLRWLSPLFALVLIGFSLLWPANAVSRTGLIAVGAVLLLAALRALTGWKHSVVSAPFYFVFGQVALAIGLFKGFAGRQTVLWAKANR
jgi:poly-beta-1,6-N-acetyl-D-glucosamine synthase